MQQKIQKNLFSSEIIAFQLFTVNSPREYLPSAANVLTNSPMISHITNRDILKLDLSQSD